MERCQEAFVRGRPADAGDPWGARPITQLRRLAAAGARPVPEVRRPPGTADALAAALAAGAGRGVTSGSTTGSMEARERQARRPREVVALDPPLPASAPKPSRAR